MGCGHQGDVGFNEVSRVGPRREGGITPPKTLSGVRREDSDQGGLWGQEGVLLFLVRFPSPAVGLPRGRSQAALEGSSQCSPTEKGGRSSVQPFHEEEGVVSKSEIKEIHEITGINLVLGGENATRKCSAAVIWTCVSQNGLFSHSFP